MINSDCNATPSSSFATLNKTNVDEVNIQDEEVLMEPRFKYSRVLGDLSKILEIDGASCFAVHNKFITIGCKSGKICVFDHLGNAQMESTNIHHKCAVNCIAIDSTGNYLASCANDFFVLICGIGCNEYNQQIALRFAARSIAISEDFNRQSSGQKFVVGERDLVIFERNFLGRYKSLVLYHGLEKDGIISTISCNKNYIAFTNESGTRVYNIKLARTITLIQPLHKVEKQISIKFQPRHAWLDSKTIAISWEKNIQEHGEIIYRWTIPDFLIGGISFTLSFKNVDEDEKSTSYKSKDNEKNIVSENVYETSIIEVNQQTWREIVVFGIRVSDFDNASSIKSENSSVVTNVTNVLNLTENQQSFAQLLLLQPINTDEFQLISEDTIEIKNATPKNLNQFSIGSLSKDNLFFLLGPRELIETNPCSVDDRINWYLDNELYVDAINCALKNQDLLQETSVVKVGRHLISYLINNNEFDIAIKFLPEICGKQKEEWEYYFSEFEKAKQLLKFGAIIPIDNPQLEPECYESILTVALYSSTNLFRALIFQWNTDLYRVAFIRDKTIEKLAEKETLSKKDKINIFKVLAHLYVYERDFKRAINIYLLLRDPSVFGVIDKHNLFSMVQDQVVELMEINTDLTIRLLLDNEFAMSSKNVINALNNHPKLQIAYLNKLHNRGEGWKFADLTVRLYGEYDKKKLLPFLRKSENYKIDKALDVCKQNNLIKEKIFLLGKSGNRLEALEEIINKLGKIEMAIEFCKEHKDDLELWNCFIELSIKNPDHISTLLSMCGTIIDKPLYIIEKIPSNMEIKGLKNLLLKVMNDSEAQLAILNETLSVSIFDVKKLFESKIKSFTAFIDTNDVCILCGKFFFEKSIADDVNDTNALDLNTLKIFFCGHRLHYNCLNNKVSNAVSSTFTKDVLSPQQSNKNFEICPFCFEQENIF